MKEIIDSGLLKIIKSYPHRHRCYCTYCYSKKGRLFFYCRHKKWNFKCWSCGIAGSVNKWKVDNNLIEVKEKAPAEYDFDRKEYLYSFMFANERSIGKLWQLHYSGYDVWHRMYVIEKGKRKYIGSPWRDNLVFEFLEKWKDKEMNKNNFRQTWWNFLDSCIERELGTTRKKVLGQWYRTIPRDKLYVEETKIDDIPEKDLIWKFPPTLLEGYNKLFFSEEDVFGGLSANSRIGELSPEVIYEIMEKIKNKLEQLRTSDRIAHRATYKRIMKTLSDT